MTQQEKEQRLLEAAKKAITKQRFDSLDDTISEYREIWIEGAKWQSQQKQETPELEEIRKEWNRIRPAYSTKEEDPFNFFAPYIKGTEWIKCSEQMPDHNGFVLVFNADEPETEVCIGIQQDDNGFMVCELKAYSDRVTHWMEIPKAPKEVGG